MKKLARKLSIFALSSVILLANSPIKAGKFSEGQTYNLDTVGTITINNHKELCDDREYFEFVTDNNRVSVEVGTDDYEVTVYNSAGDQLLHTYEQKTETITKTLVLGILATTLTELVGSNKNKKLTEMIVEDKLSPTQQSTKKPKRTTQDALKLKKLAKTDDPKEEAPEKSCIAKRTCQQTKVHMPEAQAKTDREAAILQQEQPCVSPVPSPRSITRSLSTLKQPPELTDDDQNEISKKQATLGRLATPRKNQQTKITDRHIQEKKLKKSVEEPIYRKITYELPEGKQHDYKNGHCACETPAPGPARAIGVKIGPHRKYLRYYPCLTCKRPIRRSRASTRDTFWKTYCPECKRETEFYMEHGTGTTRILRCCNVYPFEIHEIEYANTAEFNEAAKRRQIVHMS
ncbi:MAG: hypothetical protein IJC57_00875 [Clostridia bacterium]|nr:hypothetical protein [Clostridia bacterium]